MSVSDFSKKARPSRVGRLSRQILVSRHPSFSGPAGRSCFLAASISPPGPRSSSASLRSTGEGSADRVSSTDRRSAGHGARSSEVFRRSSASSLASILERSVSGRAEPSGAEPADAKPSDSVPSAETGEPASGDVSRSSSRAFTSAWLGPAPGLQGAAGASTLASGRSIDIATYRSSVTTSWLETTSQVRTATQRFDPSRDDQRRVSEEGWWSALSSLAIWGCTRPTTAAS